MNISYIYSYKIFGVLMSINDAKNASWAPLGPKGAHRGKPFCSLLSLCQHILLNLPSGGPDQAKRHPKGMPIFF